MKWSMFCPFVCNFYSFFMVYIISVYKNNIKYDFTILESYFINHGKIFHLYFTWYTLWCIKTMNTERDHYNSICEMEKTAFKSL